MNIKLLTTSHQRSWGATLKQSLGDTVLVFVYPHAARRLFHTFLCPPLHIQGVGERGEVCYDEVIEPGKFVSIPPCKYVIESAPDYKLPSMQQILQEVRSRLGPTQLTYGGMNENIALDRLLWAMLKEAMADLRRVNETIQPQNLSLDGLREKFSACERGQIVNSAACILEFVEDHNFPYEAVRLSRRVLQVEKPYVDELAAAAVAGGYWQTHFKADCVRCGKEASWKFVVTPPETVSPESAWRYQRPENAVPLCRRCTYRVDWHQRPERRLIFGLGVWGRRFEAFWKWHCAAQENNLPVTWDRAEYPLWPREFGGDQWETGCGSVADVEPRMFTNVYCERRHVEALAQILNRATGHSATTPLANLLEFPLAVPHAG